jgi:hypothetical protein
MAGASGGRKAVCPGLVDLRTIQKFHSPEFLESPCATNLVFEGNPCHEEALAVAKSVGVDFTITVTLDKDLRMTGVFAGDLEKVLEKAVEKIKTYVAIPVEGEFDIVLTHGGYVGRNHYQTAKAAVGAIPAVKEKGVIIIAADNRDPEPIGGPEYKTLCHLLKLQGPGGYVEVLQSPSWKFTKDQWEPEVWGKVLRKVGEEGMIYCTSDIPEAVFSMLPGASGYDFLTPAGKKKSRAKKVQEMVQNAVFYFYQACKEKNISPRMAFVREGPYAVPLKKWPARVKPKIFEISLSALNTLLLLPVPQCMIILCRGDRRSPMGPLWGKGLLGRFFLRAGSFHSSTNLHLGEKNFLTLEVGEQNGWVLTMEKKCCTICTHWINGGRER